MSKEADAEAASADKPSKATFKPGDLVWYRVKGFPFWPAKILRPDDPARPKGDKPDCYLIRFFGTKDYYYAPCKDEGSKLLPLNEHWEAHSVPTSRLKHLTKAIEYAQIAKTLRSDGSVPVFDDGVDDKEKSIFDTPTAPKTPKTPKTAPPNLGSNAEAGSSSKETKGADKTGHNTPHVSSRGRKRTATPLTNMGRDYAKKERKESPQRENEEGPARIEELDTDIRIEDGKSVADSKISASGALASDSSKSPGRQLRDERKSKIREKGSSEDKDKDREKERTKGDTKEKEKSKEKVKDKDKDKDKDKNKEKEKKKAKEMLKDETSDSGQKSITSLVLIKSESSSTPHEKKHKTHKSKKPKDLPTEESTDEKVEPENKKKTATTPEEVLKMVGKIESYMSDPDSAGKIITALSKMMTLEYSLDILKKTGVGLMIRKLRQMENKTIRRMCKAFRKELVAVVEKSVGSNAWAMDPLVNTQDAKPPAAQEQPQNPHSQTPPPGDETAAPAAETEGQKQAGESGQPAPEAADTKVKAEAEAEAEFGPVTLPSVPDETMKESVSEQTADAACGLPQDRMDVQDEEAGRADASVAEQMSAACKTEHSLQSTEPSAVSLD